MLKMRFILWLFVMAGALLRPTIAHSQDEELPNFSETPTAEQKRFKALLELSQSVELGQTARSLRYAEDALALALQIGDSLLVAHCYNRMGIIMKHSGDHTNALQFYMQALALYEHGGQMHGQAVVANNVGRLYLSQQDRDHSVEYYEQSIALKQQLLAKAETDKHALNKSLAISLNNMGMAKFMLGNATSAIAYLEQSKAVYEALGNAEGQADAMTKMAQVFQKDGKMDQAQTLYEAGLALREREGQKAGLCDSYLNLGSFYLAKGVFAKSRALLLEGMTLAFLLGDKEKQLELYRLLAAVEEGGGNTQKSLDYFKQYDALKDSLFNIQRAMLIADSRIKYESEKKEKENELLRKEQTIRDDELKLQNWQLLAASIGLLFLVVVAGIFYRNNIRSQRANSLLFEQNMLIHQKREEIASQKEDIEAKNKALEEMNGNLAMKNERITDSLIYGQSVQEAVLPSLANFRENFQEAFVLYRPKDIVSGDFYWLAKTRNKTFVAVADCTGHGVPGAFMSLLGYAFLHEIIVVKKVFSTNSVLESLHETIERSLHQRDGTNQDGMTIALCAFERQIDGTIKASFSGAKMDMLHCREGQAPELIEGDRLGLGGDVRHQGPKKFNKKKLDMLPGDQVYFFTDGYPDQANAKWRRFGSAKLIKLIEENAALPMHEQGEALERVLDRHQGGMEQRDDITVVGIRL